ncbi:MAG TPA: ATP-grasp domain-containing protein [Longimicrobium sp.]|nr:ATP-grasp domain-containing protein [Longimicrobium sp.]
MTSLGICTSRRHPDELTWETRRLYEEACARYDAVRLIDPRAVTFAFVRGEATPRLEHRGEDVAGLTTLIVRSTTGREAATAVLVRALRLCGCDVFDPVERFAVGKASKLLTTLTRFQSGAGTSTYVSFSRDGAAALLRRLGAEGRLPLLLKPASGRKGRGIQAIDDVDGGLRLLQDHFGYREYADEPFFLQDLVAFRKEYRVLVLDGVALAVVEKVRQPGSMAANAARGAEFVAVDAPDVVRAALPHVSGEGVLGVDVGVDTQGDVHVIEANRAPEWAAFEAATGLNVARLVIDRALQRQGRAPGGGRASG